LSGVREEKTRGDVGTVPKITPDVIPVLRREEGIPKKQRMEDFSQSSQRTQSSFRKKESSLFGFATFECSCTPSGALGSWEISNPGSGNPGLTSLTPPGSERGHSARDAPSFFAFREKSWVAGKPALEADSCLQIHAERGMLLPEPAARSGERSDPWGETLKKSRAQGPVFTLP